VRRDGTQHLIRSRAKSAKTARLQAVREDFDKNGRKTTGVNHVAA
jgi:hypothetical protein